MIYIKKIEKEIVLCSYACSKYYYKDFAINIVYQHHKEEKTNIYLKFKHYNIFCWNTNLC